jgi:hypothetical protein
LEEQLCIFNKLHELGCISEFFFHLVEIDPLQVETQSQQINVWCKDFVHDLNLKIYCCDATTFVTTLPTTTPPLAIFFTCVAGEWTYVDFGLAALNLRALWLFGFKEHLKHLKLKPTRFGDEVIDLGEVFSGSGTRKFILVYLFSSRLILTFHSFLPITEHQYTGYRVEALNPSELHDSSYNLFAHTVVIVRDGLAHKMHSPEGIRSQRWNYEVKSLRITLSFTGYESDKIEALTQSSEAIALLFRQSTHVVGRHDQQRREKFLEDLRDHPISGAQGPRHYNV